MNYATLHTSRTMIGACVCLCTVLLLVFPKTGETQQSSLSVSVTPPLFQLTIGPGEYWASSIKVINNNPYDVTYYTEAVDFEAEGEAGKGKFVPLIDDSDQEYRRTFSLASWIDISPEPVMIPRGMSREIPFSVTVPEDAEPGGHYAAILVGTQPGGLNNLEGPSVKVSSFVSSLLFARISGEVIEQGRIREFTSTQSLYQTPKADFILRFENTGNTHLQPQGDITIYNMWGKERGQVFINQKTNFGHVLPNSTRKFTFTWSKDADPFDIGRYSAVVTLAYGDESKRNVSATTYFWVVPVVPVAVVLGVLSSFIALVTWFIRIYIRRALYLERARAGLLVTAQPVVSQSEPLSLPPTTLGTFVEPLKEGVVDLRSIAFRKKEVQQPFAVSAYLQQETQQGSSATAARLTFRQFLHKYRLFFLFIGVVGIGVLIGSWYFSHALVPEKEFEISGVTHEEEIVVQP